MSKVVRKPPSQQTYKEKLINLKAARAARKRKGTQIRKRPIKKRRIPRKKPTIKPGTYTKRDLDKIIKQVKLYSQAIKRKRRKPQKKRKPRRYFKRSEDYYENWEQ